jgi:hypothetical protein
LGCGSTGRDCARRRGILRTQGGRCTCGPSTRSTDRSPGRRHSSSSSATRLASESGHSSHSGNPTDRIAPAGAKRGYYDDKDWQAAVERLALGAACIVGVTGASASTAWELTRIRELGLEQRLFLVSPPRVEQVLPAAAVTVQHSRTRRALGFVRELFIAYRDDDTAQISRLLSFGRLPGAWSPSGLTAWPDFVRALAGSGYVVAVEDPGPGAVLRFDPGGKWSRWCEACVRRPNTCSRSPRVLPRTHMR